MVNSNTQGTRHSVPISECSIHWKLRKNQKFWKLDPAKEGADIPRNYVKRFVDNKKDMFNKKYRTGVGSGISLTYNEIKDNIKVIGS